MNTLNFRNLKIAFSVVVAAFLFSIVARAGESSAAAWCAEQFTLIQNQEHKGCTRTDNRGKVIPVGLWQIYDPSTGQVIQELSYDQNGKFDGEVVLYYSSENSEDRELRMKEHRLFRHGVPNGVWTQWYRNGKIQEERKYLAGELHGLRKRWDENGVQDTVMCFVQGKRIPIGKCASFNFDQDSNRNLASPTVQK